MLPLFESAFNFTDIRSFLAIAIKHVRLMILCFCLGLCLGLLYLTYKRPLYYSKALIHVINLAPLPVDAETVYKDTSMESIISQLNSPHIMERTALTVGIKASYDRLMDQHIKLQKIAGNSEGDLVLELWPYNNGVAQAWAKALVDEYLAYRDEKRAEQREKTIRRFQREMEEVRRKMEEFEQSKYVFQEENQITENKRLLTELSRVPLRLIAVNEKTAFLKPIMQRLSSNTLSPTEQLSLIASTRKRVEELEIGKIISRTPTNTPAKSTSDIIITPDLVAMGEPWQLLEKDLRRIQQQLAEAEKTYLPGHQKIIALKNQQAKIEKEIAIELDMSRKRFDLEFAALEAEKRDAEQRYHEFEELSKKDAAIGRAFALMQAGRLSWEVMYNQLATLVQQYDFGGEKERATLQYMGLIDYRNWPISPYRRKIFLYAMLLGLGMAIGIPFLLEYLDDTISFDEQAERQLGLRTIGIIPEIDKGATQNTQLNLLGHKRDRRLTEYFRVIRVNLMSNVSFKGPRQVIMIASSLPKEGKSVVALNLAISFAMLGEKTLLIDADLRRGSLHHVFDISPRPGLGQILIEAALPRSEAVIRTPEPNLDFLPCGRHIHSASELLESEAFGKLMKELRGQYTRIVLDTPPVLGLAETSSMVKEVDGIIMVVWSGNTALKAAKTAKSMLDINGAKYFGCVLNKLDLSNATAYYYYYYYSYKYYQAYHKPLDPPLRNPPLPTSPIEPS